MPIWVSGEGPLDANPRHLGHPENADCLQPDRGPDELDASGGCEEVLHVGWVVLPHQVGNREGGEHEGEDGHPSGGRLGEDATFELDPVTDSEAKRRRVEN